VSPSDGRLLKMHLGGAGLRLVEGIGWQLRCWRTVPELERAAVQWLFAKFRCWRASYTYFPPHPKPLPVRLVPSDVDESTIERSIPEHYAQPDPSDHPLTRHYFYERRDLSPIRMSDVISDRQLRSIRIYCDVFRPAVTHQVALVYRRPPAEHLGHTSMWQRRGFTDAERTLTRRAAPVENASYTLMRQGGDFTETEPELAIGLQVLLYALCQVIGTSRCATSETTERLRLTRAKWTVLNLLACGLAAVASGTGDKNRHGLTCTVWADRTPTIGCQA
jgi:hypothetical protein